MTTENMTTEKMPAEIFAPEEVLALEEKIYFWQEGGKKARIGSLKEIAGDRLVVAMHMTDAEYAHGPEPNASFHCAMPSEKCTYRFSSVFCASSPLPDRIWYMETPAEVERQQKRDFVRVPAPFPMQVVLPNLYGGRNKAKDTTLVDISGNGVSFVWKEPLEGGMEVEVTIPDLPAVGELKTKAVVMRSIDRTALATPVYHIGAHFAEHIDKKQQNQLVRCIFLLQRKYLERGLGI